MRTSKLLLTTVSFFFLATYTNADISFEKVTGVHKWFDWGDKTRYVNAFVSIKGNAYKTSETSAYFGKNAVLRVNGTVTSDKTEEGRLAFSFQGNTSYYRNDGDHDFTLPAYDISAVTEGQYEEYIGDDWFGDGSKKTFSFYYDKSLPSFDLIAYSTSGIYQSRDYTRSRDFSVSYSNLSDTGSMFSDNPVTYVWKSNGIVVNQGTVALSETSRIFTSPTFQDGQHSFEVIATDRVGNQTSKIIFFNVDTTPPSRIKVSGRLVNSNETDFDTMLLDWDSSVDSGSGFTKPKLYKILTSLDTNDFIERPEISTASLSQSFDISILGQVDRTKDHTLRVWIKSDDQLNNSWELPGASDTLTINLPKKVSIADVSIAYLSSDKSTSNFLSTVKLNILSSELNKYGDLTLERSIGQGSWTTIASVEDPEQIKTGANGWSIGLGDYISYSDYLPPQTSGNQTIQYRILSCPNGINELLSLPNAYTYSWQGKSHTMKLDVSFRGTRSSNDVYYVTSGANIEIEGAINGDEISHLRLLMAKNLNLPSQTLSNFLVNEVILSDTTYAFQGRAQKLWGIFWTAEELVFSINLNFKVQNIPAEHLEYETSLIHTLPNHPGRFLSAELWNSLGTQVSTWPLSGSNSIFVAKSTSSMTLRVAGEDADNETWSVALSETSPVTGESKSTKQLPDYHPGSNLDITLNLQSDGLYLYQFSAKDSSELIPLRDLPIIVDSTPPLFNLEETNVFRHNSSIPLTSTEGSKVDLVDIKIAVSSEANLDKFQLWSIPGQISDSTTLSSLVTPYKAYVGTMGASTVSLSEWDTNPELFDSNVKNMDGLRTIVIRIADKAGNTTTQAKTILVRKLHPAAVKVERSSWNETTPVTTVSWAKVDTAVKYDINWICGATHGTARIDVNSPSVTSYSYSLDMSKFPGNTKVVMSITAVDGAYNETETIIPDFFSPATFAAVNSSTIVWTKGVGTYTMNLPYSGGSARTVTLERQGNQNLPAIPLVGGFFRDTGIAPHTSVSYRLVGTNQDTLSTISNSFTIDQPQNTSPPSPSQLTPISGFRGPNQVLKWTVGADFDNDKLTSRFFIKEAKDTSFPAGPLVSGDFAELKANGESLKVILRDNTKYNWKVIVDDDNGGIVSSVPGEFTFDSTPPQLSWSGGEPKVFSDGSPIAAHYLASGSPLSSVIQKTYRITKNANSELSAVLISNTALLTSSVDWSLTWPETSGTYRIELIAQDSAENVNLPLSTKSPNSVDVVVDRNKPMLSSALVDGNLKGSIVGISKNPTFFSELSATDGPEVGGSGFSGVAKISVQWVPISNGTAGNLQDFIAPTSSRWTGTVDFGKASINVDVNPGLYNLKLYITDRAGNQTIVTRPETYLVDLTPPTVELTLEGAINSLGMSALADPADLGVHTTVIDEESLVSISDQQWGIGLSNNLPTVWYSNLDEAKVSLSWITGASYRVWVRATNGSGGMIDEMSSLFLYDPTAPIIDQTSLDHDGLWAGESLRVLFNAHDSESRLSEYRISIGTATEPKSITSSWAEASDGELSLSPGQTSKTITIPMETPHGVYQVTVKAFNGSRLSATSSTQLTIREIATRPPVRVTDVGPWGTSVRATFGSDLIVDHYEYRLWINHSVSGGWISLPSGMTSILLNSDLIDKALYQVEVLGVLADESTTESRISSGVTIDLAKPVWVSTSSPEYWDGKTIPLSWTISSTPSRLVRISLRASYDGLVGNKVIDLPVDENSEAYPLSIPEWSLADGKAVSLTLEMESGAGNIISKELTPAIVDTSPPPNPIVWDQGRFVNGKQGLLARWTTSVPDSQSGTAWKWTVTKTPGDLSTATWIPDDGTHRASVGPYSEDGALYYFVVKATNGAGLESTGFSDGILIDLTAPYISSVRVTSDPEGMNEVGYAQTTTPLYLVIEANDPQSGIGDQQQIQKSYSTVHGRLDGDVFTNTQGSIVQPSLASIFRLNEPSTMPPPGSTPLVYQGKAFNGAQLSEVGYSAGVYFSDVIPSIEALKVTKLEGKVAITWTNNTGLSGAPIKNSRLKIYARNAPNPLFDEFLTGSIRSVPTSAWGDGKYEVQVFSTNLAGLNSAVASSQFWIDSTPPRVPTYSTLPAYVASHLTFTASSSDDESSISEWRYRVGTKDDPNAISSGWVSVVSETNSLAVDFALDSWITDGERIGIEVQAKNRADLWTAIIPGPVVVLDRTPATISDLSVPITMNIASGVTLLGGQIEDLQSGIVRYTLTVKNAQSQAVGNTLVVYPAQATKTLSVPTTFVPAQGLVHGQSYNVVVQAFNGANGSTGANGTIGTLISSGVKIDLLAPQLSFVKENLWGTQPDGTWVVNSLPSSIKYRVGEDVSTSVTLNGTVSNPYNNSFDFDATFTQFVDNQEEGSTPIVGNSNDFGVYTLSILQATDAAGNKSPITTQRIRYNKAPNVVLVSSETTPNAPKILTATVSDLEGDTVEYLWDFGDGSTSNQMSPTHRFDHRQNGDQVSEYPITLTVTDAYGAKTVKSSKITVKNTSNGPLYKDEIWSGTRTLTGTVTIPSGITLTVLAKSQMKFQGNNLDGFGQGLVVEGTLVIQSGVRFTKVDVQTEKWSGILVKATGTLNASGTMNDPIQIMDAERGIAVSGGSAAIIGTSFSNNEIGLHVLGLSTVTVKNSQFVDSRYLAIKEDKSARPQLMENRFIRNFMNYYQWDGGSLSVDEINELTGRGTTTKNTGNQGE